MIRGVAFDMDGLMFDTERLVADALLDIGREEGLNIDMDLLLSCVGVNEASARAIFQARFGEGFDYDRITRLRLDRVAQRIRDEGMPVKKGLPELLKYLKEHGYAMTVATSTSKEKARWYFRVAGIDEYFDRIVTGDQVTHSKPHPETFLRAAQIMNLHPEECLACEDSYNGIRSAHAAGMACGMVPDLRPPNDEMRTLSTWIKDDLTQVIPLLEADRRAFGGPRKVQREKPVRILCLADEEVPQLWGKFDPSLVEGVDMILSCGDLKSEYMDFLVTMVPVPLYFVAGNHDRDKPLPAGCEHIDGRLVTYKGVRILGFDGCNSTAPFAYHFSERQMNQKVRRLYWKLRRSQGFDILLSHAGPAGIGDGPGEYHKGFVVFRRLLDRYRPAYAVHGHTHLNYTRVDRTIYYGQTRVVNAFGFTILEFPPRQP